MLIIDRNTYDVNSRNDIKDENNNVEYYSQYDFAYKKRSHVYDNNNNEIGYVQYKILSIQDGNNCFYKDDKQIDLNDLIIKNQNDEFNFDVYNDEKLVMSVISDKDFIKLDIKEDAYKDRCLLLVLTKIA